MMAQPILWKTDIPRRFLRQTTSINARKRKIQSQNTEEVVGKDG